MTPLILRVRNCVTATPRSKVVRLDLGTTTFEFDAGQAALLGLADQSLRRPYSIASAPVDVASSRVLEFLVQETSSGSLGPHLAGVRHGAKVAVEGPLGSFGLACGSDRRSTLFVAGGSGISPLRSMLRQLLSEPGRGQVSVAYSARTAKELAYAAELRHLSREGAIRLLLTTTREPQNRRGLRHGRLTARDFRALGASRETRAYVCGPESLVRDVPALLMETDVAPGHIYMERW